jgi:hypothetical protein
MFEFPIEKSSWEKAKKPTNFGLNLEKEGKTLLKFFSY